MMITLEIREFGAEGVAVGGEQRREGLRADERNAGQRGGDATLYRGGMSEVDAWGRELLEDNVPPTSTATVTSSGASDRDGDRDGDVEMAEAAQEPKDKGKRSKKQRQADDLHTIWLGDKVRGEIWPDDVARIHSMF